MSASAAKPEHALVPMEPDIDENGVDRAQIRRMLDLSPAERLATMTAFMASLIELRAGHGRAQSD